ncbi:right-handed parallel beta-helix repeat-containing protein [Candidatus Acetothermia bacterium]|nr:right-handed parallel beta-helix repeat-containing protein [Candidatus Acetothermia bacterium]
MIKVDKPLDIESRDGAAATVLDGGKELSAVVGIFASNVVFGRKKKGFTLTHGNLGMYINFGTSGVRVEGNLVIADGLTGFELNDSGLVLNGNQAIANMLGFVLNGSGHQLSGNIASANSDKGFAIGGNGGHHFSSNVASANGTGFDVAFGNSNVFTGNIVHGNRSHGFLIESGAGHMLTGNSILGNGGFGIDLSSGAGATITKNNIYGNGEGLRDDSGAETNATNNFWGAATGPGDNPADGLLIGPTSNTIFTPFATKEFKIKTVTPLAEPGLIILTDPEQSEIPQAPSLTPIQFLKALQTKEGWLFRTTGNVSALRLEVMDLSGKKIYDSGLVKGQTLSWTRVNAKDQSVAKGVYLYRLTARDRDGNEIHSELRKLIIENFFE